MLSLRSVIFRTVIQPSCSRALRSVSKDPGVGRRKKLLGDDIEDLEELEDFESSDFMEVHKSHKQYLHEIERKREQEKHYIVRQKYFKEKFPNFLTWHDIEQIRYLHRSDPDEWTIDRLSEGFPALPGTVVKIVKTNYAKTQSKIANHDSKVQTNWKLFKQGKFADLPPDLVEHLNKFTNRALTFKPFVIPENKTTAIEVKDKNSRKVRTEFSEIISSYEKLKKKSSTNEMPQTGMNSDLPKIDSQAGTASNRMFITFQQLQSKVTDTINAGSEVNEEDARIMATTQSERKITPAPTSNTEKLIDFSKNKYQHSSGVLYMKKEDRDWSHLNYPEKINISTKLYKKGFTYKLNDCYYDDDGQFLYRVPGMS